MSTDHSASESESKTGNVQKESTSERETFFQQQLTERFAEIATLTRLLAQAETSGIGHDWRVQWLSSVAAQLRSHMLSHRVFGWKRLADGPLLGRLKADGLFDAEAYLAANPDVRAAGADPLQHFLLHGINEGRPLGL